MRDRTIELSAGDILIVPRGVEHRPVADAEVEVLLFEPSTTLNTGNLVNARDDPGSKAPLGHIVDVRVTHRSIQLAIASAHRGAHRLSRRASARRFTKPWRPFQPSLRERKPAPDRWSVAEVVEHLSMVERRVAALLARQVTAARANGMGPDPDTTSVVSTYVEPHVVVDRTKKISAPALVQPTGTVDSTAGTEALVQAHAVIDVVVAER